jgi:hypothetical protein
MTSHQRQYIQDLFLSKATTKWSIKFYSKCCWYVVVASVCGYVCVWVYLLFMQISISLSSFIVTLSTDWLVTLLFKWEKIRWYDDPFCSTCGFKSFQTWGACFRTAHEFKCILINFYTWFVMLK